MSLHCPSSLQDAQQEGHEHIFHQVHLALQTDRQVNSPPGQSFPSKGQDPIHLPLQAQNQVLIEICNEQSKLTMRGEK